MGRNTLARFFGNEYLKKILTISKNELEQHFPNYAHQIKFQHSSLCLKGDLLLRTKLKLKNQFFWLSDFRLERMIDNLDDVNLKSLCLLKD